jgi:hypothetical protein
MSNISKWTFLLLHTLLSVHQQHTIVEFENQNINFKQDPINLKYKISITSKNQTIPWLLEKNSVHGVEQDHAQILYFQAPPAKVMM